jgi:putative sigma-54 modulation protein
MELHLTSRNLELTPALKEYANKKIAPINERFQTITTANLVFHIDNRDHCAEATIHINGHEVHATAQGSDLYEAIDLLSDKLFIQLNKLKERNIDGHR